MYHKSPLNYVGGKYKLLSQLFKHFPTNINTFVDLFCGGLDVSLNISSHANVKSIIANDFSYPIIDLLTYYKSTDPDTIINSIESLIKYYNLSMTNKEGYLALRHSYNENPSPEKLATLISYAFSNNARFNKKFKFNSAFGMNRSYFTPPIKENTIKISKLLSNLPISFTSNCFTKFDFDSLSSDDFVYCDPPYHLTDAPCNRFWNETLDNQLLNQLDSLHDNNIRFALSGVLENKGIANTKLSGWASKYTIHHLNISYNNACYAIKDKSHNTDEVLITNY